MCIAYCRHACLGPVVLGFQLNYIEKGVVAVLLVIACFGYKQTSLLSKTILGLTCFPTRQQQQQAALLDSPRTVWKYKHKLAFSNHDLY